MYSELNKQIEIVKEKQWKKRKWQEHLDEAERYLREEQQKASTLYEQLKKEKADVERLERVSLTNLFYTITGRKLEKLDKEQQELLAAELKYDEAKKTVEDLQKEIRELDMNLQSVKGAHEEYKEILAEKERLVHDARSLWSEELYVLSDEEAELTSSLKEYKEAIAAGNMAEEALNQAIKSLQSAQGWATWDMIGGGLISTAIKHSHLDDAKEQIHRAQMRLRHFQTELQDIKRHFHVDIEIGNFLTFADYFFDGLIVDWVVHGKISDSLSQANETKRKITPLLNQLKEQKSQFEEKLESTKQARIRMVEEIN
ncbi:hypothetical protein [Bacillus sp. FJAT-45350]|uniref:hypothetical protein n=1 Tax=Bacillus sp. FJAT-45350 TaxID=2011014 RepID=UPI000BB93739|nr:hypothetical protein [Bacillus sp. FJAT-45350]